MVEAVNTVCGDKDPEDISAEDLAARRTESDQAPQEATGPSGGIGPRYLKAVQVLNMVFGEEWVDWASVFKDKLDLIKDHHRTRMEDRDRVIADLEQEIGSLRAANEDQARQLRELREGSQGANDPPEFRDEQPADGGNEASEKPAAPEDPARVLEANLVSEVQSVFGSNSDLSCFVCGLEGEVLLKLGYACLFSLPWPPKDGSDQGSRPPDVNALIAMSIKFLSNIERIQFPQRRRFLDVVAAHLTEVAQAFVFHNAEGHPFDGSRHITADRKTPPSSDPKVRSMKSFLVTHRRTGGTYKHAVVTF